MDFFEAQDRARRRTKRLVLLFVLAVGGTILAGYLAVMGGLQFNARSSRFQRDYQEYQRRAVWPDDTFLQAWWDPRIFGWVALGTIAVVGTASLYKWSQLRQGGAAVAEMVGGRALDPKTTDPRERRLLNVVEEMAIASGIPMPAVYVLDQEPALNAFAAGLTTSDAAVAVTRGTLDKLTRDELQGVVAHEFSHILNGDMRLNVRITGVIFGILVIGLIGRGILYSLGRGRVRSGGGRGKGGGIALIVVSGLAMMIIGYLGYFFGRLIQAGVSRQREFLADASAVQFTRNPLGIAGALKKIGGYALGGQVLNKHAGELGHFFFAQSFRSSFAGLWATHPPLEERIRAVEPSWDGQLFDPPEVVDVAHESFAAAGFVGRARSPTPPPAQPAPLGLPPRLPSAGRMEFAPAQALQGLGTLTEGQFRSAQALLDAIPDSLRADVRDPANAQILVYGLLLAGAQAVRERQEALIVQHAGPASAAALAERRTMLAALDPAARLPLLQLALPALRALTPAELNLFATLLDELVHADGQVTPFEFALQKMLLGQLALAKNPHRIIQYDSFSSVSQPIAVVLSALAHFSAADPARAFATAAIQLPLLAGKISLQEKSACGLGQVDVALDQLAVSSLPIRKRLLIAAAHGICSDGTITQEEGELFRALAATLELPMPPIGPLAGAADIN